MLWKCNLDCNANDSTVMSMVTLASVHVFITSNLRIFVNRLVTYRVSKCLTICHTSKFVPQPCYYKDYFDHTLKYASFSTSSTINFGA
jgi:hypothetical protein